MVYFKDSHEWIKQSTLLLEACPTTTRITTRYTLLPLNPTPSRRHPAERPHPSTFTQKSIPISNTKASEPAPTSADPPSTSQQPRHQPPSRAHLVLKTYDPVSGICLKYRTDKAAEVGRLIAGLGKCGRAMAALPEMAEKEEADIEEKETAVETSAPETKPKPTVKEGKEVKGQAQGKGGGGGGGGKKKKGKR
ncbi:hypothetical protein MMC06_005609 [Schaereria dolodes]|nr:hypothetical protein [Schaereria dolodes]